jgi:hypothetical protein
MKIKKTTDLSKYGFKVDRFGAWYFLFDDYTGKDNDKNIPVQVMLIVFDDREICLNINNDHVKVPLPDDEDYTVDPGDSYSFEETISIPDVIIKLILNNEIELTSDKA